MNILFAGICLCIPIRSALSNRNDASHIYVCVSLCVCIIVYIYFSSHSSKVKIHLSVSDSVMSSSL